VGTGNGGNITLNPQFIVLDNGKIIARTVEGHGGNIDITTTGIYRFPPENQNPIDASSQLGVDGVVTVDSPDVDVSGQLIVLSAKFLDASDKLQASCGTQLSKNKSSFIVKHLTGSPSSPQDWKSNILILLSENDIQDTDFKDKSSTNSDVNMTKVVKITCAKNLNKK